MKRLPTPHTSAATRASMLMSLVLLYLGCDIRVELGGRRLLDASFVDASTDSGPVDDDADTEDDDFHDQNEEDVSDPPRPCTDTAQCSGEERLCNVPRGFCVECLRDADCPKPTDRCEPDGECDEPE